MAVNLFDKKISAMNFTDQLLSFKEIDAIVSELKEQSKDLKRKEGETRMLENYLSFAEHQYGSRVTGKSYRERDGDEIDNWNVDIDIYYDICDALGTTFFNLADGMDKGISQENTLKKAIHHFEKCLCLLEPWRLQIDSEETERVDELDQTKIDDIFYNLADSSKCLGDCQTSMHNFAMAQYHYETAISNAKRVQLKRKRTALLYTALSMKGQVLHAQLKLDETEDTYKELHDSMVEVFPRGHTMILMAANFLIKILVCRGKFIDAINYARSCYESLSQSTDTESEDLANAAESLAAVISKLFDRNGGDGIEEAVVLARRAVHIKENIHGINHPSTASSLTTLCDILQLIGNSEEIKGLLERCLAIDIKRGGDDCHNVAVSYKNLGIFRHEASFNSSSFDDRIEHLRLAVSYLNEGIRISTKIHGPLSPATLQFKSIRSEITGLHNE